MTVTGHERAILSTLADGGSVSIRSFLREAGNQRQAVAHALARLDLRRSIRLHKVQDGEMTVRMYRITQQGRAELDESEVSA